MKQKESISEKQQASPPVWMSIFSYGRVSSFSPQNTLESVLLASKKVVNILNHLQEISIKIEQWPFLDQENCLISYSSIHK